MDRFLQMGVVMFFVAITVAAFLQVFSRFVLGKAFIWTDEFCRYGLVWLTFSAAALGFGRHAHIAIDVFVSMFPKSVQKVVGIIHSMLICLMGLFLLVFGAKLALVTMSQVSPALRIPMGCIYAALPFFGIVTLFFSLLEFVGSLGSREEPTGGEVQ